MSEDLVDRFAAVVIASRVGDAMGTPTEGLDPGIIHERFGWVDDFTGDGTDDSLMATLLAAALTGTRGAAGADDWAERILAHRSEILDKRDKFFPSVLHLVEKLDYGFPPSRVAHGNMPSTSSAMCIWPVGLVNAGDPRAAAAQAYALAGLIHTGEVDFCTDAAAAVAATVAAALCPGTDARRACATGITALRPRSGTLMRDLITEAIALADSTGDYPTFRREYQRTARYDIFCDSRETVPAAFGLVTLAEGRLATAVEYAANFGRDADTIAAMTGAICGAVGGLSTVPTAWLDRLGAEAVDGARSVAAALAATARERAEDQLAALRAVPGRCDV